MGVDLSWIWRSYRSRTAMAKSEESKKKNHASSNILIILLLLHSACALCSVKSMQLQPDGLAAGGLLKKY
jgi:hypothetical protein